MYVTIRLLLSFSLLYILIEGQIIQIIYNKEELEFESVDVCLFI
jgi:hypothetical protein